VAVLVFWVLTVSAAPPVQWKLEDGGNGHWYQVVHVPAGINWTAARDTAATILPGGYLATITSAAENDFVWNETEVGSNNDLWIIDGANNWEGPWLGGYRDPALGWQWVTGEPWSFTAWATGEPNNSGGNEWCLQYFWNPSLPGELAVWNDVPSYNAIISFVVESSIPEPATLVLLTLGCLVSIRRA